MYSPFKLLDPLVNTSEMFIHHEDVRRAAADWQPRVLDDPTVAALRRPIPLMARVTMARLPARVSLRTPDGASAGHRRHRSAGRHHRRPGGAAAVRSGRNAVRATFTGDDDAIAAVKAAKRGL